MDVSAFARVIDLKNLKWNDIAELVGLLAILLGIYLVYAEIQQNNHLARAELASDTSEYVQDIYAKLCDPQFATLYVKGQHSPADLTDSERLQLTAFFEQIATIISREGFLFDFNVFRERESVARHLAQRFFASGYGAMWWNARKNSFWLSDIVDAALSGDRKDDTLSELDRRINQHVDSL